MNEQFLFALSLAVLTTVVWICDRQWDLLRDITTQTRKKPFSFSRVQQAWWSIIIIAAFATLTISRGLPSLDESLLILLGITFATTASARAIDVSDRAVARKRSQDEASQGFFLDILSDKDGVAVHRLQTVLFNLIIGGWFIASIFENLAGNHLPVIPVLDKQNLILLGLSDTGYLTVKSMENKPRAND